MGRGNWDEKHPLFVVKLPYLSCFVFPLFATTATSLTHASPHHQQQDCVVVLEQVASAQGLPVALPQASNVPSTDTTIIIIIIIRLLPHPAHTTLPPTQTHRGLR